MGNKENNKHDKPVKRFQMSVILLLIALVSITAASVAWFTISDNGRVKSMDMEITSGKHMRFDLDAHASVEQYVETLQFDAISARIKSTKGFDMKKTPLMPVTTRDCKKFTYQDGSVSDDRSGDYLTFTLHFMADENMIVHLTSNNEEGKKGTLITSKNKNLADAMRISFTADEKSYLYDPGLGNTSKTSGSVKTFGLPDNSTNYNDNNAMFELEADTDKEVEVHIWLEGTDEKCNDSLKGSDYSISLKFEGTDEHNNPVGEEGTENTNQHQSSASQTHSHKEKEYPDTIWGRIQRAWDKIIGKYNK